MKDFRTTLLIICAFTFAVGCAKRDMIVTAPASRLEGKQGVTAATNAAQPASDMRSEPISVTDIVEGIPAKSETATEQSSPLETVYFVFDSWLLTAPAREALVRNAHWFRENPDVEITVVGHTDERGSDAYNLALGEQRAKSTLKYLVNLGIDAGRMQIVSYGEEQPAVDSDDESAWSKNRRVEFIRQR